MNLQEIQTEEELVAELLKELGEEEPTCQSEHRAVPVCSVRVTHRLHMSCPPSKGWMLVCQECADYVNARIARSQAIGSICMLCRIRGVRKLTKDCWRILPV
jgi:hypothetical protein